MISCLVVKLCAPKVNTTAEFTVSKVKLSTFFFGYLMTSEVKGYEIEYCWQFIKVYAP